MGAVEKMSGLPAHAPSLKKTAPTLGGGRGLSQITQQDGAVRATSGRNGDPVNHTNPKPGNWFPGKRRIKQNRQIAVREMPSAAVYSACDPKVDPHVPQVRASFRRDDAYRCLPVLLRVSGV